MNTGDVEGPAEGFYLLNRVYLLLEAPGQKLISCKLV